MAWEKTKDELRQETARTYNTKKKTHRWCKGKPGVPHVTEMVINHNWSHREACKWYPLYYSFKRRDEGPRDYRYSCMHSLKCINCGKYVEYFIKPEKCPDAVPKPNVANPAH